MLVFCDEVFNVNDLSFILDSIKDDISYVKTNKNKECLNIPIAFDIETTSFRDANGNKCGIMYVWMVSIYGKVIIGRTWEEFVEIIQGISSAFAEKTVFIYVHNLSYEFQFIRKWFVWDKVFAVDALKPVYVVTGNIVFRCSYLLSGYSLENLGKQLVKYKVEKLVGDLDYTKPRHSKTPLTAEELGYCINDVQVVVAYIQEKIEQDGGIHNIPLTKTGYVRRYCRNACFVDPERPNKPFKRMEYRRLMKDLSLTLDEYNQMKRAFQGGFTHANAFYTGKVVEDVSSFDFTSSYPTVMVAEKFPMSKGELFENPDIDLFNTSIKLYCCIFDVEFQNLRPKIWFENYLSSSRCEFEKGSTKTINNGRVVSVEGKIWTTITEQDFLIIRKCYMWDNMQVRNLRRYRKGYLPADLVKSILELYGIKTTLKGVSERVIEYNQAKENINSIYGSMIMAILRTEHIYTDHWLSPEERREIEKTPESIIDKYNKDGNRFNFYAWGVYITAYARRNLWSGILEFGEDYIYSDTDSIKCINVEKHMDYINKYNSVITEMLEKACAYHGFSIDMITPENIKGEKKPLGIWDFDGHFSKFKTLGSKRYLVKHSLDSRNGKEAGKYKLTVSGLSKKVALKWLIDTFGDDVFSAFDVNRDNGKGLRIPPEHTGKLTHTYIDEERRGKLRDYLGVEVGYYEKSSINLEPAEYHLSVPHEYLDYFLTKIFIIREEGLD